MAFKEYSNFGRRARGRVPEGNPYIKDSTIEGVADDDGGPRAEPGIDHVAIDGEFDQDPIDASFIDLLLRVVRGGGSI